MLPEFLLHVSAETSRDLRRLGLVGDAVALWSRATRCRRAWASHEANCHRAVAASVEGLARRRTALVLGSGLLRDIALPELLRRFNRVVLVDAVHLWPARRKSQDRRIARVVADLTGWATALAVKPIARPEPDPLGALRHDAGIDFVLSANVLSQLPMAVARRLERHDTQDDNAPDDNVSAAIIAAHLSLLRSFEARVCLLTDVRHREIGLDGTTIRETDLLHGARLPKPDHAWDWEVAPPGEVSRKTRHTHRVHAYLDLRAAEMHDDPAKAP